MSAPPDGARADARKARAAAFVGPAVETSEIQRSRWKLAELSTPHGFVLGDVIAQTVLASDWLADQRRDAVNKALTEIAAHVRSEMDNAQGADFTGVLVATVNAYSDACHDQAARIESESGR